MDEIVINQLKVEELAKIISPKQRSPEWFAMRNGAITASDGGCVLGVNKYEPSYKFIVKKVFGSPFKTNQACYHGKKLENIATMIYSQKYDVSVSEFGLLTHPNYKFLGASPDGIVNKYKQDGVTPTDMVGRMLEIKCPVSRNIELEGNVYDICPEYYWVQVQLQLECCDLDLCDFWQCKLTEYKTRQEFLDDTPDNPTYLSKTTNLEKGCLIQLLPKIKMEASIQNYFETIYNDAAFIYPPKIHMTPLECDIWISETMSKLNELEEYREYFFDRVIYWRLEKSGCYTIKRDKKWFAEKLPELSRMWTYVEFFRTNSDLAAVLNIFIEKLPIKQNNKILDVIKYMYDTKLGNPELDSDAYINKINEYTSVLLKPKPVKARAYIRCD